MTMTTTTTVKTQGSVVQARVHRIEGQVMPVNSYLVEAPDGIVIVDGMLTVTDAARVRQEIDHLGKPVLGAIVTHAHPDHYAGMAEILRGRTAPVFATAAVRRAIERDDATKDRIVGPMMGQEWPSKRMFPNVDVDIAIDADGASGAALRLGSLSFQVVDLGPAESPADSLYRLSDQAWFVGDLVYAQMHAYLADGFARQWLTCLDRLERDLSPSTVLYPGHGAPGGGALIQAQRDYVRAFVESVDRHLAAAPAQRQALVVADMKRLLPTEDLAFLMELSVDAFAAHREGGGAQHPDDHAPR